MAKPTKKPRATKRASTKKSLNSSAMKRIKGGDESPKETITFGYAKPQVRY